MKILDAVEQLEREMIRERITAGLNRAKASQAENYTFSLSGRLSLFELASCPQCRIGEEPVMIYNEQRKTELGNRGSRVYINQEDPRWKYPVST